jgi:hypothetical protein
MAGAIVSQSRLMGIAPGARALAIHAFSTGTQQSPQATTQSIVAGLEWALNKGARIINMSFAGPYDPILALAIKKASARGAILIAAVGNAGPKSPPLYPGADPHVIGVTATDENDKLYKGSNVGAQVAVAAPGVDVMVPAPAGAAQPRNVGGGRPGQRCGGSVARAPPGGRRHDHPRSADRQRHATRGKQA